MYTLYKDSKPVDSFKTFRAVIDYIGIYCTVEAIIKAGYNIKFNNEKVI